MAIEIGNAPAPLTITYRPGYSLLGFGGDLASATVFSVILYLGAIRKKHDWGFLIVSSLGTLSVLFSILYRLAGRSQLEFSDSSLVIKEFIFGVPRWRTYELEMVGRPYWVDKETGDNAMPAHLEFECGPKEVSSCRGITQEEVEEILLAVRGLYPKLGRRWDSQRPFRSKSFITLGLS